MTIRLLQFVLLLILVPAPPLASAGADDVLAQTARAVFSEAERRIIREYLREHRLPDGSGSAQGRRDGDGPPAGKGKGKDKSKGKPAAKALPPGIAMKLERGGTIPPGIARTRLPGTLDQRLPPARAGYERAVVDGRIVLVQVATGIITDIVDNIMDAGRPERQQPRRDAPAVDDGRQDRPLQRDLSHPGPVPDAQGRDAGGEQGPWWRFWD